MSERELVPQSLCGTQPDRQLASRLQHHPTTQQLGVSNPGRIRGRVAAPFALLDFDTAAGTVCQGFPDGALRRGLDRRTGLRKVTSYEDKGFRDEMLTCYFQVLTGPANRGRSFQVMRRTWASWSKKVGVDAHTRSAQMGNTVDVNENEYAVASFDQKLAAVRLLETAVLWDGPGSTL